MAITEDCAIILARQLVGEMLLDDDALYLYLGEEFADTIDPEDMEKIRKHIHVIAGTCIKSAAGEYVGMYEKSFKSWANKTVLRATDKGNV